MRNDVPSVVMNKLFNSGYEEQIIDIALELENDTSCEISDIPLSPNFIFGNKEKIIISEKVYDIYKQLIKRINNSQTAQEIPFLLLGSSKIVNNEEYIIFEDIVFPTNDFNELKETSVSMNEELFKQYVSTSAYNIISIGHTHGNVEEQIKNNSVARKLSDTIKEKYSIRDTGLNVSVSDIWQHEAFKQISSTFGNKRIMQTIIMYNGDIICISDKSISKSECIMAEKNNEIIDISLFEDIPNKVVR